MNDTPEVLMTIEGEYMRSIVDAYNGSMKFVQHAPVLEIYERDGELYACDYDLPKEEPFEFKLEAELIHSPINSGNVNYDA